MAGQATINLKVLYQNIGERRTIDHSFIVSNVVAVEPWTGLLSGGQSTTINRAAISGRTTGVIIKNISAQSTYGGGLFIMLSGTKQASGLHLAEGRSCFFMPVCALLNVHLYCSAQGTEHGGSFIEYSSFEV